MYFLITKKSIGLLIKTIGLFGWKGLYRVEIDVTLHLIN